MNTAMPDRQRGIGLSGLLIGAFLLVFLGITGLKLVPAYMQAGQIKSVFESMVHDPDLQKATPHDIKTTFEKQAVIDDITAIHADDIEMVNDNGRLVLSASYEVRIPLGGNIALLLTFNPSSAQ